MRKPDSGSTQCEPQARFVDEARSPHGHRRVLKDEGTSNPSRMSALREAVDKEWRAVTTTVSRKHPVASQHRALEKAVA